MMAGPSARALALALSRRLALLGLGDNVFGGSERMLTVEALEGRTGPEDVQGQLFRRLAESSTDGARAAIELLREQDRLQRIKAREGMKIGGLVNIGVGVGLTIFLRVLLSGGPGSPYLCGLIPLGVGAALLFYALVLAAPVE